MANEIGRLFQGILDIEVMETCFFVHKHKVPWYRKVAYSRIALDIRPQKKETRRLWLTVGGEKLFCNGPVSTPTADSNTDKLYFNSVFSIPDGECLIVYFKNIYLNNPTKKAVYYKTALKIIPQDIIDKCDLINKKIDGYIYIRVKKRMYGLVQAVIIARESLK